MPLLGMAVGAAIGALKDVREKVTPGTSALFLMTSNVVQDKVFDQFRSTDAQLVSTNLSVEQEQRLREVFGEEQEIG
jgi:uncharacterized membrane protein